VLADNDPELLDLLETDLNLEGYDVVATVQSGEAALEVCAQHRPDVLVVDYRMPPGLNGLETAQRARTSGIAAAVILYTNYRLPDLATQAHRFGATVVVKGPLRALRAALAEAVGAANSG